MSTSIVPLGHRPGINVARNKKSAALAESLCRETWPVRAGLPGDMQAMSAGSYASAVRFGDWQMGLSSDGIGSKIEVAERLEKYDSLGWDLMAMVVDDLAAQGYEPSNVSNVLDVDKLDDEVVRGLFVGLVAAAREAHVALSGGEIAELGARVCGWGTGMHFNWSATAIGFRPPGQPTLDGLALLPGDVVVGLASRGFRSNGFSLLRAILGAAFGDSWAQQRFDDGLMDGGQPKTGPRSWGQVALTPSRLFSPIVQQAWKQGLVLHGLAHVTGGGVFGALHRLLAASGLGVEIEAFMPAHPEMIAVQKLGDVDDLQAYRQWNMGQGMLLALAPAQAQALCAIATAQNCSAQLLGYIRESPLVQGQCRGAQAQAFKFFSSAEAIDAA